MLHCIQPHRYDIAFRREAPRDGDFVLVLRGGDVLFSPDGFLPAYGGLRAAYPGAAGPRYLFSVDDERYFFLDDGLDERAGFAYRPVMSFRGLQPRRRAFGGVTAAHLGGWYARNRFCGACGLPMEDKEDERARLCRPCGVTAYPAIAPCVIVAVTDGERLLLTRYANRGARNYALVAGFVEAGECLEDAVRREVMEETGVRVKNPRYYKSQPWGFSSSLLSGFYAELDGSDRLTVDTSELETAVWLRPADIPPPDVGVSLTAEMIDAFRRGEFPG